MHMAHDTMPYKAHFINIHEYILWVMKLPKSSQGLKTIKIFQDQCEITRVTYSMENSRTDEK